MQKSNKQELSGRLPFTRRLLISLLRAFFRLLYHQLAWTYNAVASFVSVGMWQKWIQSAVPYLVGPRILEIGFGPGHLLVSLSGKNLAVYGLDESCQMAYLAKKRLARRGVESNLIRGDALALPFSRDSFEQAVMTFPAEYILKAPTLAEIRRVLVDGGQAILIPLAWITGRKPWERFIAWLNRFTGEAPEWDPRLVESIKAPGFQIGWEMREFPNSQVLVIRLEKIRDQGSDSDSYIM